MVAVRDQQPRAGESGSQIVAAARGRGSPRPGAPGRRGRRSPDRGSSVRTCRLTSRTAAGPRWTRRIGAGLSAIVPIRAASSVTCCGWTPSCGNTCRSSGCRCDPRQVEAADEARARSARSRSTRGDRARARRRGWRVRVAARSAAAAGPHGRVARTRGRRRVTDPSRSQRQCPERRQPKRAGDVRRDRRGTGLHRCIVGVHDQGARRWPSQGASVWRPSYDLLMFDLDGVVYVDGHAVDHAAREHRRRPALGRAHRLHHQQRLADPRAGRRAPPGARGRAPTRRTW